MKDCTSIVNSQPPGERKELLETLQKQIGEVISGPPEEKQQLKKMVADRLKELTEGVTTGTPDRAWYSVSSKGLLEAAKFCERLVRRDWRHVKESRQQLLARFQAYGHSRVIGPHPCKR